MQTERLTKARELLESGSFERALQLYNAVLIDEPYNEDALFGAFLSSSGARSIEELSNSNVFYVNNEFFKELYNSSTKNKEFLDNCIKKTISVNLNRGKEILSSGNFPFAKNLFQLVLAYDGKNSEATLGMLLVDLKVTSIEQAEKKGILLSKSIWFSNVLMVCDDNLKTRLNKALEKGEEVKKKKKKKLAIILSLIGVLALILVAVTIIIAINISNKNAEYLKSDAYIFGIKDVEGGVEIGNLNSQSVIVNGVLEIPAEIDGKKVVGIGKQALVANHSITTVILPDGIEYIDNHAFRNCVNLKEINLPDSLNKIGESSFKYCNISEITIPSQVKTLESYAFFECPLIDVTICEGVTSIEDSAIYTSTLKSLTLPSTIQNIEDFLSISYLVENLTLYVNADILPIVPFLDYVTKCVITGGSTIQKEAFRSCDKLKTVILCESIISIEDGAFAFTDIESIFIPKTVTSIGSVIFECCNYLTEIRCEISESELPSTWAENWNNMLRFSYDKHPVTWGCNE